MQNIMNIESMNSEKPMNDTTSKYSYRVDSISPYSNARPQSFCHTLEQAERLKAEHQAHLPGCETTITELPMAPRQQIERDYDVRNGRIVSPGKFEGEPIFAPYFWNAALEGMADDDDGECYTFALSAEDHALWPELKEQGWTDTLMMWESEQGFVYCR